MTEILRVDPAAPDPAAIARAAAVLRAGGLVAFPTETVYGLGAHALDPAAVQRIYDAKGRPGYNPLIVHVPDAATARRVVTAWPERAERLARAFRPGPLTLVLPRAAEVPDIVTAGGASVAVRVPAHPVALALLRAAGLPVAAPSANRSTELSPTTAAHVAKGLGGRVDLILDGGPTSVGIESTVLDLTSDPAVLLRPGVLSLADLEPFAGPIVLATRVAGDAPRPSPGMMDRHYAPRAELRVLPDRETLLREAAEAGAQGRATGVITRGAATVPGARLVRSLADAPRAFARDLYAALHAIDDAGCDLVLVEGVPDTPAWAGVRDRLARAARKD